MALAAALAARCDSALRTLYLEDESLLRMAGLPQLGRVIAGGRGPQVLSQGSLEGQWRALAARARTQVGQRAAENRVQQAFEVRRSTLIHVLEQAGAHAEAVVVASRTRPRRPSGPLGPGPAAAPLATDVHVALEGVPGDLPALSLARQVAGRGGVLHVWRSASAAGLSLPPDAHAHTHRLPEGAAAAPALLRALAEHRGDLLILQHGGALAAQLRQATATPPCTLIFTR